MAVAMAFPCRRTGSKMVGGGGWVRKISKVAGALSSRGICRANGRRLIAKVIFKNVFRVARNNQSHFLQYWTAFICLVTITVLTGLAITLNIWHNPDFNPAIFILPTLSCNLSDLVNGQSQNRNGGLVAVAAIAAVVLQTLSRTVLVWLCCKQSRLFTGKKKVCISETGTLQVMDSRQSSLPSRDFPLPRNAAMNKWPSSNRSYGQQDVSFAHHDGIRAPSPRSDPRSIRWAREVPDQIGTDTLNHGHYSAGTSEPISPNQDPFLDGHNEKVSQEKFNQRLLRKVKSYMTLSPGSRTGDSPSVTTKKGFTISQPSEFRSMNNLRLEAMYTEAGAPIRTESPMRLVPLPEQRGTPLRESHGPSPTTKKGLAISHPFGLRSVNNLRLEGENTEARVSAQLTHSIKRKPVPARNGGLPRLRGLHASSSIPSHLGASEYDHGDQVYQISPRGPLQMSFGDSDDPTRDDRLAAVATRRFTQEEASYKEKGYGQDDRDPYHQEHGNSPTLNVHIVDGDDVERWERKKGRQEEKILAALANDGSCLLLDYNGSGKTVKFKVVTSPNDWTESDRLSSSASTDTLRSLPNSLCFDRLRSRTKTNNRLSGLGAAPSKDGKQDNRRPRSLESLYELSEASNESHRSSGAYRMSGSSTSSPLSTGESSLRSSTRLSSSTASKTQGGGLFSSFLKKEPSAVALSEYSRRAYASKGVDPKDPDAAAKMKISTRRLPPEAPKPASKEPRKKKGGGPADKPEPSTNTPGRLRRLTSLDNLSLRLKEDQLGSGEGMSMRVERSSSGVVPVDTPTFRKIDDRKTANFPVVPEPSVERPLTDFISPYGPMRENDGTSGYSGPRSTESNAGLRERAIGDGFLGGKELAESDTDLRRVTVGAKMQPRDILSEGQQGIAEQDLAVNGAYADVIAGPPDENEGEGEMSVPAVKTGLTRSLAQRRRHRKREELGMRGRK